jgi:hypothetical protein
MESTKILVDQIKIIHNSLATYGTIESWGICMFYAHEIEKLTKMHE